MRELKRVAEMMMMMARATTATMNEPRLERVGRIWSRCINAVRLVTAHTVRRTSHTRALSPLFVKTFTVQLCEWTILFEVATTIYGYCIPKTNPIRIFTVKFERVRRFFLANYQNTERKRQNTKHKNKNRIFMKAVALAQKVNGSPTEEKRQRLASCSCHVNDIWMLLPVVDQHLSSIYSQIFRNTRY